MDIFVARQPIFDRAFRVFGYELLFRQGAEKHYFAADADVATSSVIINSLWVIGLEHLTNSKQVFINITENILKNGTLSILPPVQVVLEILESVEPSAEIIQILKELKRQRFTIALDDFTSHPRFKTFVEVADIIKIDILATPLPMQKQIMQNNSRMNVRFLAEKVETYEQYGKALEMGYSYFQGYFFSKPFVVSAKDIPSNKLAVLRLIQEINQPDLDIKYVSGLVHKDVSLSYKLLKFINSATFGFKLKIVSVEQAMLLLGQREIVKWISLIAIREFAEEKPNELLRVAVIRARMCELLACEMVLTERANEAFTMGLFSLIDALLDKAIPEILKDLPVSDDVGNALLGRENQLFDILQMVKACEIGEWADMKIYGWKLNIPLKKVSSLYLQSLKWVHDYA